MQESFWWWQYSVMYGLLFPPPPEFSVPASSSSVGDNLALNGFNQRLPGSRRNIIHCRHSSQMPSWMRYDFASHFAATWSRSLESEFTLPGVDLRSAGTFLDREHRFKILWSDAEWRPPSQLSSNRSWTDYCPVCFFLHCRVEFADQIYNFDHPKFWQNVIETVLPLRPLPPPPFLFPCSLLKSTCTRMLCSVPAGV